MVIRLIIRLQPCMTRSPPPSPPLPLLPLCRAQNAKPSNQAGDDRWRESCTVSPSPPEAFPHQDQNKRHDLTETEAGARWTRRRRQPAEPLETPPPPRAMAVSEMAPRGPRVSTEAARDPMPRLQRCPAPLCLCSEETMTTPKVARVPTPRPPPRPAPLCPCSEETLMAPRVSRAPMPRPSHRPASLCLYCEEAMTTPRVSRAPLPSPPRRPAPLCLYPEGKLSPCSCSSRAARHRPPPPSPPQPKGSSG